MQRLDKVLSEAKVGTRKQIKALIRTGGVLVDGQPACAPEQKVAETAEISVRGERVERMRPVLIKMYKPAGYITATEDRHQPTVMELLPEQYRKLDAVPVGRLDKETEGLLLFTNDGELAHKLISPRYRVKKRYYAEHDGAATEEDVAAFAAGLVLADGTECLPAKLEPLGAGKSEITVYEGKYHQVRRMMASRGLPVHYLCRLAEGAVDLSGMSPGEVEEICFDMFGFDLETV